MERVAQLVRDCASYSKDELDNYKSFLEKRDNVIHEAINILIEKEKYISCDDVEILLDLDDVQFNVLMSNLEKKRHNNKLKRAKAKNRKKASANHWMKADIFFEKLSKDLGLHKFDDKEPKSELHKYLSKRKEKSIMFCNLYLTLLLQRMERCYKFTVYCKIC